MSLDSRLCPREIRTTMDKVQDPDDNDCNRRSPMVVARLMGLDNLHTESGLGPGSPAQLCRSASASRVPREPSYYRFIDKSILNNNIDYNNTKKKRAVPELKPDLCVRASNSNPNLSAHMPFQRSCYSELKNWTELETANIVIRSFLLKKQSNNERKNMHRKQQSMHRRRPLSRYYESLYSWANYAEYSYSELQDATNNFDKSFKLGEGGFGIVYKGILHKSKTVAIKMLKEGSSQGAKEFNQEVEILRKVQHPNLVKLIGSCAETRALVYEYLPNGSLEDRLRCKNNTLPLSWQARVCTASEICSALIFLHSSEPHGVVHGDLKPDNILLGEMNTSKICDFGLCRELNFTSSASNTIPLDRLSEGHTCLHGPRILINWEVNSSI